MCVIIYNVGSINNNIEVSVRDKTSELLLDRDYITDFIPLPTIQTIMFESFFKKVKRFIS